MTFRVVILSRARLDVDAIYAWIQERSQSGAARWYSAFLIAASSLIESPERCSLAAESERIGITIRQRFFRTRRGRTYRLLFTIIGTEVRILRVRGPGQRPVKPDDVG